MFTQKSEHNRVIEIFDLAKAEAKKLRAKNPRHELLRLLANPEDNAVWEEFQNRFNSSRVTQGYFWGRYYLALKDALSVGDDVCFTQAAIESEEWVGKIDPADVFKIMAIDSEGRAYLNGVVAYDNGENEVALMSVDQSCLRKAA